MVFNNTRNYQFSTRLDLEGHILETVHEQKLVGTILTEDLKQDRTTEEIDRRANGRLQILRKVSSFGSDISDLKLIYVMFI